jgi:hypothetical protein
LITSRVMANTLPVYRLVLFFTLLVFLAPACGKEIGDSCNTNVDCDQNGNRDCDLSQPGGYCTINGCDEKSCPSEAVCIRIFPYEAMGSTCQLDSDCTSNELCLPEGFCVPRASERRYCERTCGDNGDCRGGYVCHQAGIEGQTADTSSYGSVALVATNANQSTNVVVKFCAPSP